MSNSARKIGIVAGGGELPHEVARACLNAKRAVYLVGVDEFADPISPSIPHQRISMGKLGRSLKVLRQQGCQDLVFAGHFTRPRDRHIKLRPDFAGIMFLVRNFGVLRRSNDGIHRAIASTFERRGFRVISPLQAAPTLAAEEGLLTTLGPSPATKAILQVALQAAREHGATGQGQAIVYSNGRVVAFETRKGTDAMLQDMTSVQASGEVILVKAMSPHQLPTMDPPAIGENTVRLAAEKKLAGIIVEAGRSIIVHPERVKALADKLGLFVCGARANA